MFGTALLYSLLISFIASIKALNNQFTSSKYFNDNYLDAILAWQARSHVLQIRYFVTSR